MSVLLSVDPGIRGCGCALFCDDKLIIAAYVKSNAKKGAGPRECATMAFEVSAWARSHAYPNILALEWPTTYGGRSACGDARDLFPLAGVDAAIAMLFPFMETKHYTPHEWKGSVNPDALIERVKRCLSPTEREYVALPSAKSLDHNVWDGIGVGLHALGRLERKRVFSRE